MTNFTLPHCEESEMMVLGCMITSHNSLVVSCELLQKEDFYNFNHQLVFSAAKECLELFDCADVTLVSSQLSKRELLPKIGGMAKLMMFAQMVGTSAYIDGYASVVKSKSLLRKIISASQEITIEGMKDPDSAEDFLDEVQEKFFKIGKNVGKDGLQSLKEVVENKDSIDGKNMLERIAERREYFAIHRKPFPIKAISSGYPDLDKIIGGMQESNLIILAARPGMGKTTLALNIAQNVCFREKKPVLVFSLEMSKEQLASKIVSSESGVSQQKIGDGTVSAKEYEEILNCFNSLAGSHFYIEESTVLKVTDIKARARRAKEKHGISLILIDYLQLLQGSGSKNSKETRQLEVSDISSNLKAMARELNVPVLCLSQLSRKVEERENKRPMLSDLRDSGSVEQDADVVMFIYRPDYYNNYDKPNHAELIVSKNRHGNVGCIDLYFDKQTSQFGSMVK